MLEPFDEADESKISEAEEDLHLSEGAEELEEALDHDSDDETDLMDFDTLKAKTTAKQFGKSRIIFIPSPHADCPGTLAS